MKNRPSIVCASFLLIAGFMPSVQAELPDDAIVVVMTRCLDGQQVGNGFVVGDGTLVLTCDHLVYEASKQGDHRLEGRAAVFSPHLGQACDARILASDEELDLAVLEVPWKGHPSLILADANAVMEVPSARIVGLPGVVQNLENWNAAAGVDDFCGQAEELPVAYVAVQQHVPLFMMLDEAGELGPGWSGSAMIAPGTSTALGCFNIIHRAPDKPSWGLRAAGPVVSQVRRLLPGDFNIDRLRQADVRLEPAENARQACSLALAASSSLRPGRYPAALEAARAFVNLRPESAFGQTVMAYACEKLGDVDAARQVYRRAAELDPNGLSGQILHAQFLTENGDTEAARPILERLWQAGGSRDLVAIALVNLLGEQQEFSRCLEILNEASGANPRNAHLWRQMAGCRMQTDGPDAAIEPAAKAVELYPERGPFRGVLAHLLEMTGRLDEAETHFRRLLDVEPENPVVYCWLARFLLKHRPEAVEEGLKIAEKALDLPPHPSLPRETIEALVGDLRDRVTASTPQ